MRAFCYFTAGFANCVALRDFLVGDPAWGVLLILNSLVLCVFARRVP